MTVFYSVETTGIASTPIVKPTSAAYGARFRRYRATFALATQTTSDTLFCARVPAGSIFCFGVLTADTSLATATLAIGPSGTTGKYRTAAVFTATNTPTLFGNASAIDDDALTADEQIIGTIAVASLPASGILLVDLYFSNW